jgi:HD-GYP domain-containing protein (c-di-GMP phosphodiesterase class II)
MRYVPISCVRQGLILGEDLYNDIGELLLAQGSVLTSKNIQSITRLKYTGIYIDDEISKGITVESIVSERVRAKTLKQIKDIFIDYEQGGQNLNNNLDAIKLLIENIVDEIYSNQDLLVNLVDLQAYDDYTYNHCVSVAILSIALGVALAMSKQELYDLGFAALLHDIGKVFIDKNIVNKPSTLTADEFEQMKNHSLFGFEHIRNDYLVSNEILLGILDHHERYDGSGYPNKKLGDQISWYGRIIATADVYDALTSARPYRKAVLPADAMEFIMASNTAQFDSRVVEAFTRKIAPYPVGTCVLLSNGFSAIVSGNCKESGLRPKVRVYKENDVDVEPYEIDLSAFEYLSTIVVELL